jgi:peptidoglycan/xylan/chitin deacetylase (PgdA/CDA1 family)
MNQPLELTVMMYHYVRDPGDVAEAGSGILGMTVKAFESQLDELSQQHAFVTWPEVRGALQEQTALPRSACLLTFDDGVHDHYVNVFRVLRDRGLSGLFFALDRLAVDGLTLAHRIHFLLAKLGVKRLRESILEGLDLAKRERFGQAESKYQSKYSPITSDGQINLLKAVLQRELSAETDNLLSRLFEMHVGSESETARNYYLNAGQIREMVAGGMHFGGHSRSHPWFDWIDREARTAEIKASAEWLPQFELGPWAFAYPYGGLSEDSPQLLKAHGFAAAFTTKAGLHHSDPYFIGRLDGEEIAQDGHIHA